MEIFITIISLPLVYLGVKLGLGRFIYLDRFYKKFIFWYVRIGSIAGISKVFQDQQYFLAIPLFFLVGFIWSNTFHILYRKALYLKEEVKKPFLKPTLKETNDQKIENLQEWIEETTKLNNQEERIKTLKKQLDNLVNPKPKVEKLDINTIQEDKPTPEPPKQNPIVENNKKKLESILNKLGF